MLDIKFLRSNPELVKENIKKKFQDQKLVLVDEVVSLDKEYRDSKTRCDYLRSQRNTISRQIGMLMGKGKREEAEQAKAQVTAMAKELEELTQKETELEAQIRERMLVIPNMIDHSVPIGKDDSENVELERFGEPAVRILKFLTISISWKSSGELTLTAPERPVETVFITCAATLPGCTLLFSPMPEIL